MFTFLDTLLTSDTGVGIDNFGVLVKGKVNLAKHLFGAGFYTCPASLTLAGIELDVRCLLRLTEAFAPTAAMRQGVERRHHGKCTHTDKVQGCQSITATDMQRESACDCCGKHSRHYF